MSNPNPPTPLDERTEALMIEMEVQAACGHKRFCLGAHEHESGELEYEWTDWSNAFDRIRSRIRELVEEARESGYVTAKAEVAARLIEQGATGSVRV